MNIILKRRAGFMYHDTHANLFYYCMARCYIYNAADLNANYWG